MFRLVQKRSFMTTSRLFLNSRGESLKSRTFPVDQQPVGLTPDSLNIFGDLPNYQASVTNAIQNDHDALVRFAEKIEAGEKNVLNDFITLLTRHGYAEEMIVYPLLDDWRGKEAANHLRLEHHKLKERLHTLERTQDFSQWNDIWQELKHHMHSEEHLDIPVMETKIEESELIRLGKEFVVAKKASPLRIHMNIPETGGVTEGVLGSIEAIKDQLKK